MSDFPLLKTGAVQQYPAGRGVTFATEVVRFVDGSAQRFRQRGAALRRWMIRLELLDEEELAAVERFFLERQGRLGNFTFTDPRDEAEYENCSLETDEIDFVFDGPAWGRTELVIRQNRS